MFCQEENKLLIHNCVWVTKNIFKCKAQNYYLVSVHIKSKSKIKERDVVETKIELSLS